MSAGRTRLGWGRGFRLTPGLRPQPDCVRWCGMGVMPVLLLIVVLAACTKKPAPTPPTPPPPPPQPQNIFALLQDPEGRNTAIVVKNTGGEQEIGQPDHAVRVDNANTAPSAPFPIDQPTERRLFGAALDTLPPAEVHFVLNYGLNQDSLNTAARAQMPAILRAIQERHSTNISVIGHTDTVGTPAGNQELGLRRAGGVAALLRAEGVAEDSLFVVSHGEADLLTKTDRNIPNAANRRVEVIVR